MGMWPEEPSLSSPGPCPPSKPPSPACRAASPQVRKSKPNFAEALGSDRSYPSFTRGLRLRGVRPVCEPCHPAKGRPVAIIDHPGGQETHWDWVELPDPPVGWDGYGKKAYLLVGALSHSSKWRGVLSESTEQPQLADAQYRVAAALGGLTRDWRFDRMSTVVVDRR